MFEKYIGEYIGAQSTAARYLHGSFLWIVERVRVVNEILAADKNLLRNWANSFPPLDVGEFTGFCLPTTRLTLV